MLLSSSNVSQTDFLNVVIYDYLKSCSVLYGLDFLNSTLVSKSDFSKEIADELGGLESKNIIELMNLIETIETIINLYVSGSKKTVFRNDIYVVDFSTIYQLKFIKMNKIFNFIEKKYPSVIELIDFLYTQTKIEHNNYTKGIINTENSQTLNSSFEKLKRREDITTFLEDFSPLSKKNQLKKIFSLYGDTLIEKNVQECKFQDSSQISSIILNGQNIILPISYMASRGMANCNTNSEYAIMDLSHLMLIVSYGNLESEAKEELLPINNFAILRRNLICPKGIQSKVLHFIRSLEFKKISEKEEKKIYSFMSAADISSLTSSAENTSVFLALNLYIKFRENYKKAEKDIELEIFSILKKPNISLALKLTELELYMRETSIRLMDGIKVKNENDNSGFYQGLEEYLQKKLTSILERAINE